MEVVPVTRAYLESLTTGDLIRMADTWGIDIPPDLDRVFIIEELLEITAPDDADAEDLPDSGSAAAPSDETVTSDTAVTGVNAFPVLKTKTADSVLDESVPLPKQYNISFIEVMIRDPLWAFVFWEIKATDKELFEKALDFDGYYLKVSPSVTLKENATDGTFTVPVKPEDTAWYLGLAPAAGNGKGRPDESQNAQKLYKVELCAGRRGEETVLAVSSPFKLPLLYELPVGPGKQDLAGFQENALLRLSGYEDFHILHNNERLFRIKRGASAGSYE